MSEEKAEICPYCGGIADAKWHKPPKKTKEGWLIVEGKCGVCDTDFKAFGHKKEEAE